MVQSALGALKFDGCCPARRGISAVLPKQAAHAAIICLDQQAPWRQGNCSPCASCAACTDGSFTSLIGNYSGQGNNTNFVHDTDAGYDVLQCTQVRPSHPCVRLHYGVPLVSVPL